MATETTTETETMTNSNTQAADIIQRIIDEASEFLDGAMHDTHITIGDDATVTVTYDGSGFDWLSYTRRSSERLRSEISMGLDVIGMHIEDRNAWSFCVYAD